ncbi:unnamed protein product [Litomosoides sigmodontis]|uniref:AMP-dependent synthetase/ligase domain-containing protein n=1 Tax=Litomosoides sigmodontis TaxID=42156 RepID=A0A3P6UJB5_LITSI|nr:unnamed protein product [Litomosoides sigmodontis]
MTVRNYFDEKVSTADKSFYEYFTEIIKQFGNEIALKDPETTKAITYTELISQSEQMLNALTRLGVQHGDVIGTYVCNSPAYITFVLAVLGLGAILVPLNPAYKPYEVEKYFKQASVKWILVEEKLFEKIRHLKMENMQAIIFFSSGTTGLPKGIRLSHSALIANVELVRKAQEIKCEKYEMVSLSGMDVVYGVLPYFHAGGLLTVFGLLGLVYGTTEAGAFVFMQPLNATGKSGSCGILLPSVECKIMKLASDEEGKEMEVGEIWLKTATMMQTYLNGTTDIDDAFVDGWFRSGDLGYYDSDHFIYITGRIRDMIKVRGWQVVSPYEIEETIQGLKDVELCAVIGIPDEYSGQLPKAYIQLRDGCQLDESTIHQLVNTKFASYKQLKGGIQFISNMPINSAGKISRRELMKMNEMQGKTV